MTRVLISRFDTIVGLGICEVLREGGCDVVSRQVRLTAQAVREIEPDALVVDMDDEDAVKAAQRLRSCFPGIPFVECSSSDSRIRVFPAYRFGESYDAPLSSELLLHAVTTI